MVSPETKITWNKIKDPFLSDRGIQLILQREDLIDPEISGNKWRKLKYNISAFQAGNYDRILTFGGAYSNHIAATAAAGRINNIPTVGLIRGEVTHPLNPTLNKAQKDGMTLKFITRTDYKLKNTPDFLQALEIQFPNSFIIPEGADNDLGMQGCQEILTHSPDFDLVTLTVGTGNTFLGMIQRLKEKQRALGFPVIKEAIRLEKQLEEKAQYQYGSEPHPEWSFENEAHFGGYGKYSKQVHEFINNFFRQHSIPLDPIYTGKMMLRLYEMIEEGTLKDQTILAIHTGGLQGIKGYEQRYRIQLFD